MAVKQEDCDAVIAARAWCDDMDEPEMVQAFARHREAADQAAAEDKRVLIEALAGLLTGMNLWPPSGGDGCETIELTSPSMVQINAAISALRQALTKVEARK